MSAPVLNKPQTEKPVAIPAAPHRVGAGVFRPASLVAALPNALRALDPRVMWHNPVMFVVEIGALLTTVTVFTDFSGFTVWIAVWLWLTVIFANLADSVAEGRGKAQAASLRAGRDTAIARKLDTRGVESRVAAADLRKGDVVVCEAGDVIPGDGEIIEGVASVDEAAITGESAPVVRESGGDRSSVTGGTRVLSDRIVIRMTAEPGQSFVDRMIALVEGSVRQKTPNEIALNILLASLTIVFLLVVMVLQPMSSFSGSAQSIAVLVSLLVCLIPTTIGALVSAIGVAGMDRLVQRNVLAMSGRAVEAAGDVSTLLLDKTGTITFGNRQASELIAAPGVDVTDLASAALQSSTADETPEGRSLVELCETRYGVVGSGTADGAEFIEFSARTRMSGVDLTTPTGVQRIRKGAASAVAAWVQEYGGTVSGEVNAAVGKIASSGGTPLLVAEVFEPSESAVAAAVGRGSVGRVLGVVHLKDVVKPDIADRFAELRKMGIRTVMITGDSQLTAQSIAAEAGVDDFLAEATPGGQARLHPQGADRRPDRGNDRRRHQRRPGAGAGRRRRGDELRDHCGQGGRQHGGPGLQSHQAHRHRRDRQAVVDHPRRAHHLLAGQRHRQVLRNSPRDVRRRVPGPRGPEHHEARDPAVRGALGRHLQRADHRRADPAGPPRRPVHPVVGRKTVVPQPVDLRPRRPHPPVRRHQTDRPRHSPHSRNRMIAMSTTTLDPAGPVQPAEPAAYPELPAPSASTLASIAGRQLWVALRFLIAMSVVLGIAYPLLVLGLGQLIAPSAANGSMVTSGGKTVGSSLIGQSFTDPKWFQGRPSAAGTNGYDPTASGGSNLAADSPTLLKQINDRKAAIAKADGVPASAVPADAVTASGSGLDPDISPAYALIQVDRVAAARHLDPARVRALVESHISHPVLGFIGQQQVNVLELNIALQNLAAGS